MSKRLYIITGKGGVGKTSISLALAKHLKESGKKVLYNSLDVPVETELCKSVKVPFLELNSSSSTKEYLASKVGSKFVASWIVKTPLFKAIYNVVPILAHMIFLGHIIKELETDPELTVVLDSPSTGHAISMFKAPSIFKKMFKTGIIVKDIDKMYKTLTEENFLAIRILALPGLMAFNEGMELRNFFRSLWPIEVELVMNNSYRHIKGIEIESLPNFLQKKIRLEDEIFNKSGDEIMTTIPHQTLEGQVDIIKQLEQLMDCLV